MSAAPEVTFFMLVTDADAIIADYSIRSYRLLAQRKIDFRLCVYGNCLSPGIADRYYPKWKRYPYVDIRDNREHVTPTYPRRGYSFTSPEGVPQMLMGDWETCATIWAREVPSLPSPLVATVDADFEILKPGFIKFAIDRLNVSPDLAGISSDYDPDRPSHNETYSCRTVFMHQRWHTWFCIYRKAYLDIDVSPYYYEEMNSDGEVHVHDAYGYLQHTLMDRHGLRFEVLGAKWRGQHIHYGSFVQNQKIHLGNVAVYRRLRILMKRGLIPRLGFTGNLGRLNRWVGYGIHELFMRRFGGVDRSRGELQHLLNPDFSSDDLYGVKKLKSDTVEKRMSKAIVFLKKWRERPMVSYVLSRLVWPIYHGAKWIGRRVPWTIRVNGSKVDFDGIHLIFPPNVGIVYCTLGWWQGVSGYEPSTWRVIKSYVQQADVFWDVGSNIGLYAVLAKKIKPAMKVEVFEPVPSLAEANQKFQQANQTGIEPRQIAVSSHGNGADISVPKYADVTEVEPTSSLEQDVNLSPGASVDIVKVGTINLDALADTLKPAEQLFIKIDVEGHEHHVLAGARELMKSHRPILLCEILPGVANTKEIKAILSDTRYALLAICREGLFYLDPLDMDKPRSYTDYLLVPAEKMNTPSRHIPFDELPL